MTYVCVLGLWFANTAAAKSLSSTHMMIDWQIITKYVTFYAWTNRFRHFSTCSLPIQLLLCVNTTIISTCNATYILPWYTWDSWDTKLTDSKKALIPYIAYYLWRKTFTFLKDYFATTKVFGKFLHANTVKACKSW